MGLVKRLLLVSWQINTNKKGKNVMLVAADTFRAGAVAQLVEWGRRVDVPVVTGAEKADPASVGF